MRNRLRPPLAALLAVALPGLGHALLRRWGRALVWHGTIIGGAIALFSLYDVEPIDPLDDPAAFAAAVPTEVSLPIAFLVGLSAVDAFLVGREDAAAERRAEAVTAATRRARETADDDVGQRGGGDVGQHGDGDRAHLDALDGEGEPASVSCPHCGRETDAEIDFCHWCTESFPWADGDR
ncbi:zinc ribbon domain-containing protein [Halorubrum sp. JWXQ-INN 858]|uniref:DUF7575 domain-containing protein n=1 Tax=Halorubrum sp. JWXQ-INN 858 TaxID=2690782 RepID=UPI001357BDD7|nr:zinc ribbon domain-containing protein [Halorubrum sp. JWXQ-INN 858]MWV65634.1 zinc ribbon domain-containing protein [Halorubrum sp. JWXQ-INN 858]